MEITNVKKRDKMRGIIIEFEGIDGSGKRTLSKMLKEELSKKNYKVCLYSYPDYKSKYGMIIKAFLDNEIELSVEEQFLLYLLDMLKDKKEIVQKIDDGFIVIIDRYFLSTIAYQCANNFDYGKAKYIIESIGLPLPNIIFYLEIPINLAIKRKSNQKSNLDRFEKNEQFLKKIIKVYEKMIKENFPTHWIRLDATRKLEKVHEETLLNVYKLIGCTPKSRQ